MAEKFGSLSRQIAAESSSKITFEPMLKRATQLHSDEWVDVWRMDDEYTHNVVNHLQKYVDGIVHTNGMENFWSLLKHAASIGMSVSVDAHSNDVDQSNRFDADQIGAKQRKAFLVWNSDRHQSSALFVFFCVEPEKELVFFVR